MFFNSSPDVYNATNVSTSEYSESISKTSDSSLNEGLDQPIYSSSNEKTEKIPLTVENLKKHNELMNKKELKFVNSNDIKK